MKVYIPVLILCFFVITSCSSADTEISQLQKKIDHVAVNYEQYSEKDWLSLDAKISDLEKEIENHGDRFSNEQRDQLNKIIGKYVGLKLKANLKKLNRSIDDAAGQLQGALEELSK